MHNAILRCYFIGCLFLIAHNLYADHTPSFHNYNSDNGLPGSEVHGMFQDENGYIWFATSAGVARYDGNKFLTFGKSSGLSETYLLNFFVESPHKVWVYTRARHVYYFDPLAAETRFKKHPLSNRLEKKIIQVSGRSHIRKVFISENNWYYLTFLTSPGYLRISPRGEMELFGHEGERAFSEGSKDINVGFGKENGAAFCFSFFSDFEQPGDEPKLYVHCPSGRKWLIPETLTSDFSSQFGVADYCFVKDTIYALLGKLVLKILPDSCVFAHLPYEGLRLYAKDNKILVGTLKGCFELDRNLRRVNHFLGHQTVNNICEDHEGGWWFSTLQQGVFHQSACEVMMINLPENQSKAIRYIDFNDHYMICLNLDRTANFLPYPFDSVEAVHENITYVGFYQHGNMEAEKYFGQVIYDEGPAKNKYFLLNPESTGVCGFVEQVIFYQHERQLLKKNMDVSRINDLVVINDSLSYIATSGGIYMGIQKDQLFSEHLSAGEGANFDEIESLSEHMLIAAGDQGIFVRYKNKVTRPNAMNDMLSGQVTELTKSSDSSFWIATSKGLHHVLFNNQGGYKIDAITKANGLPGDEIMCAELYHDTMWVGTRNGACFFDQEVINKSIYPAENFFHLDSLRINGLRIYPREEETIELSYSDLLDIYISQVSFSTHVTYQYRIKNDGEWINAEDNHIVLSSPGHGEKVLEIKVNSGSSVAAIHPVTLHISKPFWLRVDFYLLMVLAAVVLIWIVYSIVNRNIQKKRDERYERAQLEIKSLIAQMNPHFTFNTINSIQSFIINNDKRAAVLYISDFALLVRQTLDYSRTDFITLQDEINFVHLYVDLENRRFRYSVKFSVSLKISSTAEEILWPPFLLQPIVENSIIHAFGKITDGRIELSIEEYADFFEIILYDNGPGESGVKSNAPKTSVGLEILRDRIRLNNDRNYLSSDLEYGRIEGDVGWRTQIKLYKQK